MAIDMQRVFDLALGKLWTRAELCRQSGLSGATIYSLQSGRRQASPLTVEKLARALGVPASEITK